MTEDNEDIIRRKKAKKFSKHFDILINNKKVKILNYQIKDSKTQSEKGQIIEFISQLKFDKADQGEVNIRIMNDKEKITINGVWQFGWNSSGNHGIAYLIKEMTAD